MSRFGSELPMGPWLEIELRRLAHNSNDLVALHPPLGYFVEGKIRQKQEKFANSAIRFSDLGVDLRNALADPAHIGNQVLGVGAPPLERADRLGGLVPTGLEVVHLAETQAPTFVQPPDLIDGLCETARSPPRQRGLDLIRIAPDQSDVKHVSSCPEQSDPGHRIAGSYRARRAGSPSQR